MKKRHILPESSQSSLNDSAEKQRIYEMLKKKAYESAERKRHRDRDEHEMEHSYPPGQVLWDAKFD
jgi:hypothetical protein